MSQLTPRQRTRRAAILEMQDRKELKMGIYVDVYARSLVSATWGTALLWLKAVITPVNFRDELVRGSVAILFPVATGKSRPRSWAVPSPIG